MKIVEYVVIFDEGVRERHYHETEHGEVVKFVVQLEVLQERKWKVVVRYDCAHGFAHIDRFWLDGSKEKIPLNLDFKTALSLADWDIRSNWERYKENFLKGVYYE